MQAALGVAHRSGVVAVDRAEVSLAVHELVAHRKVLRHTNKRVVNRGVAVRVELTHHFADHARALHIGAVMNVIGFVHTVEHAPVHRFEAVTNVRERAADDYAHGVVEVRGAHLLLQTDRESFFSELIHTWAFLVSLLPDCLGEKGQLSILRVWSPMLHVA